VQRSPKRIGGPSLGGLLATRRGALVLALLCVLVATGIFVFAIGKYKHAAVASGTAKQDTVLVAASVIQKGTAGDLIASQRLYKVTPILASQVAAGAIVNAASLNGKVASSNILTGQQLTSADFSVPSVSDIAAELTPTERGVSVTLDPAHGTGVLQAGDHVDVYGSVAVGSGSVVSLLVPDAVVLKAPSTVGSASGGSTGAVLLGVSMTLSPRIMWVFDYGKVWLELRGPNATNAAPTMTGERQVLLGNRLGTTPTYLPATPAGTKP
jgi:Flp pilus assembly protein CpaB